MSDDIEQSGGEQREEQEEQGINTKNSVPIVSDKEIEAIFVGGVPAEADEPYLEQCFEKYGEIKNVKIINSVKTKKPKRFAIVTFNNPIASSILMQDHWVMGRKVDVKEYLSGEEASNKLTREKQRKVFVGGLPLTVNNEILKGYFQQFGKVIEANIVYNHETMRSRGFGFVIFQDEKTVQEVLKRYDDHYLYGKWIECKPALLKEEVTTPDVQSARDVTGTPTPNIFTPNSINNRQPRGPMNMLNKTPDMKSGVRPNPGVRVGQPPLQQNSQGSDNDNGQLIHQTNQHMNAAAKKIGNEAKRSPEGNNQYGSDEGSQDDGQGQQPMYDYQHAGMHQHSPYHHPGYNYQMSPHVMRGGQGYGMYSPYSSMMNQRPPMKPYQHPPAYNYQGGRGGYAGGMNMKGMQIPPPQGDYYGNPQYESADNDVQQMHGGHMENAQGFHAPRPVKGQKPMAVGQHPGYQYTNQHMSPMYQPVPHTGHYDPRNPYDYAPYKSKPGELGMSPGQPNYYNYKPTGIPPYSYAGGQFGKSQEQDEGDNDPTMGNNYREENSQAAGQKAKKQTMKPRPAEDLGSKDSSKPTKIGKAKQFAEDFESNDMDN